MKFLQIVATTNSISNVDIVIVVGGFFGDFVQTTKICIQRDAFISIFMCFDIKQ